MLLQVVWRHRHTFSRHGLVPTSSVSVTSSWPIFKCKKCVCDVIRSSVLNLGRGWGFLNSFTTLGTCYSMGIGGRATKLDQITGNGVPFGSINFLLARNHIFGQILMFFARCLVSLTLNMKGHLPDIQTVYHPSVISQWQALKKCISHRCTLIVKW